MVATNRVGDNELKGIWQSPENQCLGGSPQAADKCGLGDSVTLSFAGRSGTLRSHVHTCCYIRKGGVIIKLFLF